MLHKNISISLQILFFFTHDFFIYIFNLFLKFDFINQNFIQYVFIHPIFLLIKNKNMKLLTYQGWEKPKEHIRIILFINS